MKRGRPKLKKQKWQKYQFETIKIGESFFIPDKYNCDTQVDKQRAQKATGFKFKSCSVDSPKMGTLITRSYSEEEIEVLQQIRDGILKALKYLYDGSEPYPSESIGDIIQKAESLKGKEGK